MNVNTEIGAELKSQTNTQQFLFKMTPCCLAVLTLFAQQAYAETVSSDASVTQKPTAQLEKIVITATRAPKNIADIAGTVQTIEKKQIEQQSGAGRKLADVLAQLVPSLAPSSGTTSNYGQSMRGRNVLVMIDGVSQTGSRDVSRQLNSISPSMIERIEVISGATSIYGSGATGGIINIITKRADTSKPLSFESKVGITSSDTFRGDGLAYEVGQSVSFSKGNVDGFLGANFTSRGSQFDGDGDRISLSPWQGSTMDTDTIDVNGRLNFNLADNQTLSFGAQYYKDKQDTDYGPDYSYLPTTGTSNDVTAPSYKAIKGLKLGNHLFTERYAINSQYQNQDFLGQVLNIEAYYRNEKARFFPYGLTTKAVTSVNQSQSEIDVAGLRSTMQSDFSIADRDLKLTYGLDYDWEKDEQYVDILATEYPYLVYTPTGVRKGYGPNTEVQNVGAFVQGDYAINDLLNVQAGIRYQYIQADTEAYIPSRESTMVPAGSTHDDKPLFNLGAVYKIDDTQQIYANFSQGFSFPDVQRMLRDVSTYTVSTSNLQPITVNSYELGWRLNQDDGLNVGLTGFYNTSDKTLQFSNRAAKIVDTDQRVYGAEATVSYPFMDNYKVGGTLAYTRGQYKDVANKWHELNSFAVSPVKGTLFAEWDNDEGYGVRVQMQAIKGTSKAYNDDRKLAAFAAASNDEAFQQAVKNDGNIAAKIKGYATMDVLAHAPVWKGRVDFGVYNVWGLQYNTVFAQQVAVSNGNPLLEIPAEGRTYGLSYTFNY
ncbi:TonB-dependent receptor [Acinetobacter sp. NIPH 2699]|uniref:TonB-dependent receptor n=1 Tax=Acinetobacter sp. NIPH 2699 TaxID=2923433 RepID=UPI001F4AEED9|nr:TonB-dependent receptor [Acinetobacter sp. NIPH 2699]MCH7335003.1 TonB-dependent receptor [Acinetobacter sp. NIPH 2699]